MAIFPSSMSQRDDDITTGVLLDHMQNMQRVMLEKFDALEKRIDMRMDRLERRMDWLQASRDNMNVRLDDIEGEFLPKRVRKLERKVFRKPTVSSRQ